MTNPKHTHAWVAINCPHADPAKQWYRCPCGALKPTLRPQSPSGKH